MQYWYVDYGQQVLPFGILNFDLLSVFTLHIYDLQAENEKSALKNIF